MSDEETTNPQAPEDAMPDSPDVDETPSEKELRQRLKAEFENMIRRLKQVSPDYVPPPFSPRRLFKLLEEGVERLSPGIGTSVLNRMRSVFNEDLLDIDTWKGMWYMVNYSLEYQGDILKRRFTGEYETDEWGMDWEFMEVVRPFQDFLYSTYWRVATSGVTHIPEAGQVLLVGNHSGHSPWEGAMVASAVLNEHPEERLVRSLYASWFSTLPFFSAMFVKMGHAVGTVENGTRLLEQDEVVAVYPDGYDQKRSLLRRGGNQAPIDWDSFIKMAIAADATIVPTAIVGAEETLTQAGKASPMTRLTGRPHYLLSPKARGFGLLSFIPVPTKWSIDFGEAIPTEAFDADDEAQVSELTNQVREMIAELLEDRLAERRSLLFG